MYIVKKKSHDYIGQKLLTTFNITYEWDGKETVIETVEEENVTRVFFNMP